MELLACLPEEREGPVSEKGTPEWPASGGGEVMNVALTCPNETAE